MITDLQLERMLSRLERKYDADSQHWRDYANANADIATLLRERKIDHAHAHILHEGALAKLEQGKAKHQQKLDEARTDRIKRSAGIWVFLFFAALMLSIILWIAS